MIHLSWLKLAVILLGGCSTPAPEAAPELHFLRRAVQLDGGPVEPLAWTPGQDVRGVIAPQAPECRAQFTVPLEDRRADAEQGVPPRGVALAFSPDGTRLALGSAGGTVEVVSVPGGEVLVKRDLAEGAVRAVAFSADGETLYVGEQSPDANLYALDAATLQDRWRRRLADDLATSSLPPDDTMYGVYSLPSAFGVTPLDGGRLLVAGAHGWSVAGARRNKTRLWLLGPAGEVEAAYPPAGAADGIFLFPSVVERADRTGDVLLGVSRSADGDPPDDLPVNGIVDLALPGLTPRWTQTFAPLAPHFTTVFCWEGVVRGPDFAFAGLGDGRAFLFDGDGQPRAELTPGVPIVTGGVPIGVGVGFAAARAEGAWYLTTSTNIPWGSADPAARPPSAHPAENTVHALAPDGTPRWDRALRQSVAGVVPSPDGTELLVGAGARDSDTRTDLFGGVLLSAATGDVLAVCSTAAPADFHPVFAPDGGWIAIAEAPFKTADGSVAGAYQVTVFR